MSMGTGYLELIAFLYKFNKFHFLNFCLEIVKMCWTKLILRQYKCAQSKKHWREFNQIIFKYCLIYKKLKYETVFFFHFLS